jgi:hypothetical protein
MLYGKRLCGEYPALFHLQKRISFFHGYGVVERMSNHTETSVPSGTANVDRSGSLPFFLRVALPTYCEDLPDQRRRLIEKGWMEIAPNVLRSKKGSRILRLISC